MDKYKETQDTWDKVAEDYKLKFMDLRLYDSSYDDLLRLLSYKSSKILDLGCGPGNISKYLLNKNPKLNILGLDSSPSMIELAKRNNPNARFEVLDIRNIGQIDEAFDAIVCGFCIPYLSKQDCEKLLVDCSILLNTRGLIYISFVPGSYDQSGYISSSSGLRTYFYYHEISDIKNTLANHGLNIEVESTVSYLKSQGRFEDHLILIARKSRL